MNIQPSQSTSTQPQVKYRQSQQPELQLVRMSTLTQIVGYHRTHINNLINEGKFPQQIKVGPRASAWLLPEIKAWIAQSWQDGDSYSPPLLDMPKLLRRSEVLRIIGIQKDTLYRMIAREEFPQGKVLGFQERRWEYNDIMGWIASKIQERDNRLP